MMEKNGQEYIFKVQGMHCKSCVLVTESEIADVKGVRAVQTDLASETVRVLGDFGDKTMEEIAETLSLVVKPHGYTVLLQSQVGEYSKKWGEFYIALPISAAFLVLFVLLQKAGMVNLIGAGKPTYGTAFLIGIVASLSSCMAVVGGLLLSMSATFAKSGERMRPQALFHGGRLAAFFVLGGVIGVLGSAFQLGVTSTFVLSLLIGLVMIVLGINLLELFGFAKKLLPAMPQFLGVFALKASKMNHSLTPLFVGVATFFLPCGFTQSMQVYALGTGSFAVGAFTMLSFALGTLPVLGLLSFSSVGIVGGKYSGIFFKVVGIIVILFGILNVLNGFVASGFIRPFLNL